MRFSRLFNKLLRDDIEVKVYKRKADCEDGELQGDFCGSYLSGSLVPAEIWGSYVCRFWSVGEKAICVMIEEWKSNDKA